MQIEPNDDTTVPSTVNEQDVMQESSPVAPVEATTKEAVQEKPEVPFNEHPRWQELMDERRWLREQLDLANKRQIVAAPAPASEPDPYAGMDEETKRFYQNVDRRAEQIARKIAAEKEDAITREINETRKILATVAYERFQVKHPDVLPNSNEEKTIAALYSKGYSLDDAYKVAMFDRVQNQKVQQAQAKKVESIKQKVAANVEQASIPAESGLPKQKKVSIREFVEEQLRKGQI